MAGKWEVGFPKTSSCSLREQAARSILRNVRTQGHTYVDLREDGKRFVFFCTLCLAPCYSDTILFDHLKGNLHAERLSTAKVTLLGPNPWPFNDGVLFFDNPVENDKELGALNSNKSRFLELPNNGDNLAIVRYDENSKTTSNGHAGVHLDTKISSCDETLNSDEGNACVIISGVRIWDEISDIEVQEVGCGKIAARFREKDKVSNGICRIWCEWLGKKTPGNEDSLEVPEHDFAIVTFRYNADIGSKELFDRVKPLLLPSPSESECVEGASRKRMKSFSDPEDISEFFNNQYTLSGKDSPVSNVTSSRLLLAHYDDQLLHKRFISSKAMRRELRQQQRVAAERMCDICQHKMLPGKDVSALMNLKTGRLVCSSRNVHGAFMIATYWVSFVTYYLLWKAYKHVSKLRADALMSPSLKPEQYAIIVRDIPPVPEGLTRKEQVDSYFKAIYPDTFYRSMVVTDNKVVNKIWEELEGYKKKLAHAEAIYAQSKATGKPEGVRPTNKTGFLGLFGKKVDSIEYYNGKINELIPKLESERKVTLREKQQAAALVFFTSRVTAASAAQSLHAQMVNDWTVVDAPEPHQIIWANLPIKFFQRQVRQYVVYAIVALTIVFYMIPIGLISAFTTLEQLKKLLPFLKPVVNIDAIKTVLEAYLPQIALIVFLALLPKLLLFLSKSEGIPSLSHAVRASSGKYFYFTVLNVFIGVTVGGTLFSTFKTLQKSPPDYIITLLANSLPGNATFFLTFVALKFFVGYGLELTRIVPLIIYHLKRKYLCKTEAELKAAWFPGELGYGTRAPGDMLIVTIVLCYSVIAPLILPFGAAYFGLGWLILRNQALKVYIPAYESYGRMWPHLFVRILAALILYQVTMFGYFGVKKFYYTPFLIPLIILSFIFGYVCSKKFYRFFHDTALEVVCRELKEVPNMEQVFRSFIPQSLGGSEKFDDDQFEDALSQVSRTASFV